MKIITVIWLFIALHKNTSRQSVTCYQGVVKSHTQKEKTLIVVGAGVGGLAIACRIASSSLRNNHHAGLPKTRVIVLEKNSEEWVGGRCGSYHVNVPHYGSFRHERGPSLLLLKDKYLQLFHDCTQGQKTAKDYGLDIVQCNPAYQVCFDDGHYIHLGFPKRDATTNEFEERTKRIMDDLEERGSSKWDEYMEITNAYLNCGLPNFIEEKLDIASLPPFIYQVIRDRAKAWPLKSHSNLLDHMFSSTKMKAMASFQDLYVGLQPYSNTAEPFGGVLRKTAPSVFGLLSAIELHPTNSRAGVFAPIGGFQRVSEAFKRLALDYGVEFMFNSYVQHVHKDGISYKDSNNSSHHLAADLVVVNADLPYATESIMNKHALDSESKYDWDENFEYSSGVVAFHWCLSMRCEALNTHNVFLKGGNMKDLVDSWDVVRKSNWESTHNFTNDSFNFYVHRPTSVDSSAAPSDCDSIMVLVPCPSLVRNASLSLVERNYAVEKYREQFSELYIQDMRDAVLRRLSVIKGLENMREHILHETIDTPGSYADYYNLAAGSPFSLSHGLLQLSLLRPGPNYKNFPNVLFVGASSRPGNGVPLVLTGAQIAADKIFETGLLR